MNRNYWSALKHDIVTWRIGFPNDVEEEALIRFASGLLDAGYELGVFAIVPEGSGCGEAPPADLESYERFRAEALPAYSAEGRILALPDYHRFDSPAGPCASASRVAYYDSDGRVAEEWVANLACIAGPADGRAGEVPGMPPLSVRFSGHPRPHGERLSQDAMSAPTVSISSHSDIWLPYVAGFDVLDDERDFMTIGDLYDNRELAGRHTPRLNRFLDRARELAVEAGGAWEFDEEEIGGRLYPPMISAGGILLTPDPSHPLPALF